jgi:hypothetical protein
MDLQTVIGVILGLSYVYLLFSILASGLNESYARLVHRRAKLLEKAMPQLLGSSLGGGALASSFAAHPLTQGLATDYRFPSYLPLSHVAMVLIDLTMVVVKPAGGSLTKVVCRKKINGTVIPLLAAERRLVRAIIADEGNIRVVQARIEKWFDDCGDRLSGAYKRDTHVSLLAISLLLSYGFGLDSIGLAQYLSVDVASRKALADSFKASNPGGLPALPLGFHPSFLWGVGCAVTALALTLGAPFWFDFVGRFVNLRQAGDPPGNQRPFVG